MPENKQENQSNNFQVKEEKPIIKEKIETPESPKKDAWISTDNILLEESRFGDFSSKPYLDPPNSLNPVISLCRLYDYFVNLEDNNKESYINDIKNISSDLKGSLILKLNSIEDLLQKFQKEEINLNLTNSGNCIPLNIQNEMPNASIKIPIPIRQTPVETKDIRDSKKSISFPFPHKSGFTLVNEKYRNRLNALEKMAKMDH